MKPSILITFLFALAFSTEASSDAPPVPTTATFTTSLSSDKGIWVDEIPIGRGKEVRALFGQGLTLEVARIDHAATANVIVTGNNEAVGNAGYHDSLDRNGAQRGSSNL